MKDPVDTSTRDLSEVLPDQYAEGAASGAPATDAAAAASPRPVIRGESLEREAQTVIDWLRFTFLPVGSIGDALEQLHRYFQLWFSVPVVMKPSVRGFRTYEASMDVLAWVNGEEVRLAVVAMGGDHVGGTMLVDLSGKGCAVVDSWPTVYATMQDLDARITRCDVAKDFLQGEVSIDEVQEMYFGGDFNAGGRIPSYRRIEGGNARSKGCGGSTFEIGRRVNGKMLRAYEKGRQLGKQDSEWVRVEIEFGNKDRVIDHAIVLYPDRYFVGAYKALEQFLDADPLKCPTDQHRPLDEEEQIIVERKEHHMWSQCGKFVNFWLATNDENVAGLVTRIRREGVPAQLQKHALARRVNGAHEPASTYAR